MLTTKTVWDFRVASHPWGPWQNGRIARLQACGLLLPGHLSQIYLGRRNDSVGVLRRGLDQQQCLPADGDPDHYSLKGRLNKMSDVMKCSEILALSIWAMGAVSLTAANSNSGTTPIKAVVPDLNNLRKWDDMQGDTADPFWADDDNLYHFSCDGRGFGKDHRNLCFNELTGPDLLHLKGAVVNSMADYGKANETGPDHATWKVTGQNASTESFTLS